MAVCKVSIFAGGGNSQSFRNLLSFKSYSVSASLAELTYGLSRKAGGSEHEN
ncbi:MAG: hypothetical protein IJQ63_04930 [Synergistaceae bacterium]|nr:hypothetical protein [Synergistaceae bacterium]